MFISFPQKINEKPQVIGDYEAGRAIPNNQVLGKIERAIGENTGLLTCRRSSQCCHSCIKRVCCLAQTGLKLRGKDIGLPLEAKPKKKWTQSLEISPSHPPDPVSPSYWHLNHLPARLPRPLPLPGLMSPASCLKDLVFHCVTSYIVTCHEINTLIT